MTIIVVHFLQIFFLKKKRVPSFALLDEWNVNNSIEKLKIYFSIVFYQFHGFMMRINVFQYKRKENCVATNWRRFE